MSQLQIPNFLRGNKNERSKKPVSLNNTFIESQARFGKKVDQSLQVPKNIEHNKIEFLDSVYIALHLKDIKDKSTKDNIQKQYQSIVNEIARLTSLKYGNEQADEKEVGELIENSKMILNYVRFQLETTLNQQKENDFEISNLTLLVLNVQSGVIKHDLNKLIDYAKSIRNVDTQRKLIAEIQVYLSQYHKNKSLEGPYGWIIKRAKKLEEDNQIKQAASLQ